jgi:hypothetical protein
MAMVIVASVMPVRGNHAGAVGAGAADGGGGRRLLGSVAVPPGLVRGRVVRRIGAGEGSGSAGAGAGQLWISAHDVEKLYRVPVR